MKRLSLLTLVFALCSIVFFLLLIFFRTSFPLYPLMSYQDALDLLTPLVLIPIYWILFRDSSSEEPKRVQEIIFMVLASLWVAGQGMHLAANSINNLAENLKEQQLIDILGTPIYSLTYFMDEHLSHYMWHFGVVSLAVLLVWREWGKPAGSATQWGMAITSGLLYGIKCFLIFLEGQTVPLGLPFSLVFTLAILVLGRKKLSQQPVMAFFFVAFLVTLVILCCWGIYFRGFPQLSDLGWI